LSSDPFSRRICRNPQPHDSTSTVPRTRKPYSSPKESVGTTKRSIDTMPSA
jgi:hypothetical protein